MHRRAGVDTSAIRSRVGLRVFAVALAILITALLVSTASAEPITYVVSSGDTLGDIAERFGVDEDDIARANQIGNRNFIKAGQLLYIDAVLTSAATPLASAAVDAPAAPAGRRYIVRPGDNLSTIAEEQGLSVERIMRDNSLTNPDRLRIGQVLIIADLTGTAYARRWPGAPRFIWPLRGNITTYFGERDSYYVGGKHTGMDIAARMGDTVRASAGGRVITAWKRPDNVGWHLVVDHGNGYASMYAHLSRFLVDVGDLVEQGQVIALAGDTGFSFGPHLHFEIRVGGKYEDPLDFLP